MRRSERLIRNTIVALIGLMVLHTGVSRLYAGDAPAEGKTRTSTSDLAGLRDFDSIEVNGDFSVEVVQGADYSVEFAPADASRSRFYATLRDRTLVLRGFNKSSAGLARVAMPTLTAVTGDRLPALSIAGFEDARVSLRLGRTPQVTLRNNGVRQWHIVAAEVGELQVDKASLAAGSVDLAGHAKLTAID